MSAAASTTLPLRNQDQQCHACRHFWGMFKFWPGRGQADAMQILIQRGETFNVTFRDLPSSLEPPYNVTEV